MDEKNKITKDRMKISELKPQPMFGGGIFGFGTAPIRNVGYAQAGGGLFTNNIFNNTAAAPAPRRRGRR